MSYAGGLSSTGSSVTTIENSTFAGNQALTIGGGIYIDQGGSLSVTNSYFFGNTADTKEDNLLSHTLPARTLDSNGAKVPAAMSRLNQALAAASAGVTRSPCVW